MSDKFTWDDDDLEFTKLVYKGVEVDIPAAVFFQMTDEEKEAYISSQKEQKAYPEHCGFEAPVYGTIEEYPEGTILKICQDGVCRPISPEEYAKEPKTPVQAFVCNIAFPKSLEEVRDFVIRRGYFNVEDILYDDVLTWTVPNWAKVGDIVFFMHSKTAIQTIRKLCTALKHQTEYDEKETALLEEWLDKGRELYNEFGGKIFAYARVTGSPGKLADDDEDMDDLRTDTIHWKSRIYAEIRDTRVLRNPVDISEFNSFLLISRCSSITPVLGTAFEELKSLILKKNMMASDFFVDATAAPVPLSKIDETNWLSVANEYRRSFFLEQQFRSYYVDRFLAVLGDQKMIYRECRVKKQGFPDSFVDNIILFNGKYLPVEVKLNVENEVDLPGQVRKYCNDDVRYVDTGAGKIFDNARSYMNQVLVIDTEALYLYDDRTGDLELIRNLDEIKTVDDIRELRQELIGKIAD